MTAQPPQIQPPTRHRKMRLALLILAGALVVSTGIFVLASLAIHHGTSKHATTPTQAIRNIVSAVQNEDGAEASDAVCKNSELTYTSARATILGALANDGSQISLLQVTDTERDSSTASVAEYRVLIKAVAENPHSQVENWFQFALRNQGGKDDTARMNWKVCLVKKITP